MVRIESPAQLSRHVLSASKALLLFTKLGCPDGQFVKERMFRIADRNSSLVVAFADIDLVPGLARILNIGSTPTVVLFRRGVRMSELSGRLSGMQLQDLVDSVLW